MGGRLLAVLTTLPANSQHSRREDKILKGMDKVKHGVVQASSHSIGAQVILVTFESIKF